MAQQQNRDAAGRCRRAEDSGAAGQSLAQISGQRLGVKGGIQHERGDRLDVGIGACQNRAATRGGGRAMERQWFEVAGREAVAQGGGHSGGARVEAVLRRDDLAAEG